MDTPKPSRGAALSMLCYVAAVHAEDTFGLLRGLAGDTAPLRIANFDLFKFVAWFVLPLIFVLVSRQMDWGYFRFTRWRRFDWALLAGMALVGLAVMGMVYALPSLLDTYSSMGRLPVAVKLRQAMWGNYGLVYLFSWLVGWEFLHRYVLLRQLDATWPRYGWLVVPAIEGVYHLQKPLLEAGGMVAFSLVFTPWVRERRNVLLPFFAHLVIEVELLLFLLFV